MRRIALYYGSNSSEKATNVSSSQSIDIDRVINSDQNSSDSSVILPVMNRTRRSIIYDSSEEENTRHEVNVEWDWKETNNRPIIWKYSESRGVKEYVLNQLGANHGLLDLFFVVFVENFWDILVTQTNLYAEQIMNDERRRKLDDGWFPVTQNEMLAYYALCILMTQVRKTEYTNVLVDTRSGRNTYIWESNAVQKIYADITMFAFLE